METEKLKSTRAERKMLTPETKIALNILWLSNCTCSHLLRKTNPSEGFPAEEPSGRASLWDSSG